MCRNSWACFRICYLGKDRVVLPVASESRYQFFFTNFISELCDEGSHEMMRELVIMLMKGFGHASSFVASNFLTGFLPFSAGSFSVCSLFLAAL